MGKKMILKNKVVLVTGASKGIGYGIVLAMAREGADIVINYCTNRDGANKAAKEVRKIGRKALVAQADVSKALDVNKMVKLGLKTFGRIDILVNNAGIAIWKPFFEVTEEIWDRTLEINLKGAFLCSQKVAHHMKENRGGCIINISSLAAHGALDCLVPYCASKGGMSLLTKSMAVELAPYNIRVNSVAPGTIAVQRNFGLDPGYPQTWTPYIPTGRVGQVKDVAGVVIFLASDEAGYITGQTIYVDGGETSYVPMPRADFARSPEEKGG
jgi:NAD(P)-dependent dehydrogenase (short-subunit alcohol dehydrogenase family)